MPSSPPFSLHFLNNYCDDPRKGLAGFMSGDRACREIEAFGKSPMSQLPASSPYFGGLRVMWITVKAPFEAVTSVFFHALSYLVYGLGWHCGSYFFTVLAQHATRDWEQLCDQFGFEEPLIVPAFNAHKLGTWDLYGHGSVSLEDVRDEKVLPMTFRSSEYRAGVKKAIRIFYYYLEKSRKNQGWIHWVRTFGKTVSAWEKNRVILTFTNKYRENPKEAIEWLKNRYSIDHLEVPIQQLYTELKATEMRVSQINHLSLFSEGGLCRGASLWFINLLYKTEHLFDSPLAQLRSVAKQFSTGVPKEAALLQSLHEADSLIHLQKQEMNGHKVSVFELDHQRDKALDKIESLPIGIYRVGCYRHSFVYVKFPKGKEFVWNPSFGLLPMGAKELLNLVLKYHYSKGHPDSQIYFHKYSSTEPLRSTG